MAWQNGDPVGSEKPRGKASGRRKGRYDGSYTPTEQRTKDRLMKQFCHLEGVAGNSQAYVTSAAWCPRFGCRRLRAEGKKTCGGHKR